MTFIIKDTFPVGSKKGKKRSSSGKAKSPESSAGADTADEIIVQGEDKGKRKMTDGEIADLEKPMIRK